MSWDENLFKVFFDRYQKIINKDSIKNEKIKVTLPSQILRLSILASALAESHLQIFPIRHGFGRTRNKSIILPVEINFFKDMALNESLYLCRTAFSALVIREYKKKRFITQENWIEVVTTVFQTEFPGLMQTLNELDLAAEKLTDQHSWFQLSRGSFPTEDFDSQFDDREPAITLDSTNENKKVDELENQKPSLAKIKQLDTTDTNPAVHLFEKALTAEDYQGGKRQIDSDADSSDMSAALSELNMDQVVRAVGETGSKYSGGLFLDEASTSASEQKPKKNECNMFCYPEWSRRRLQFIQNWCTVFEEKKQVERKIKSSISPLIKKEVKRLKRKLEILVNKPIWLRDQEDGSELDLDAFVRFKSDSAAGSSSMRNLYIDRKKMEQDIALLILADTSLSTDAWIANKRVFETIQQSLIILSETLQDFTQSVSIAAFYSNTRSHCTYLRVKDFNEKWDDTPSQIDSLKPQGYTRIGPAIRHATHVLENIRARKKILLIISDSKPTDYDAYEGVHGESDVHHAILEARTKKIIVKGLAVTDPRSGHVKRIYGQNGFEKFTDAQGLSERIIRTYSEAL